MTFRFDSIAAQRQMAGPLVVALMWSIVPLLAAINWWQGTGDWVGVTGAALCALSATGLWFLIGSTTLGRSLSGVLLMGQISLLVANGGSWQVDLHMAYFAALALLVVYNDWVVILAAAATVAVHHLMLSYAIPSAVFPGSAGLERVALHAVILIIEAGTLILVTASMRNMFMVADRSLALSETSTRDARQALASLEDAQGRAATAAAGTEIQSNERIVVVDSIGKAIGILMEGDLTSRITQDFPTEYRSLRHDFNEAMSRLQETVRRVANISDTIRSSAGGIASNADDFTSRAEQQAASLEETAAALDEITATVRRTAEGAKHARAVVGTTQNDVQQSGEVMRQAIAAMSSIEESSSRIGQISGTIDEIAFQTNLLALNAGVEAARAGEAGRGFAVVASEVRALAQRSAEAAKEIKGLISVAVDQIDHGVELVGRTGQVLDRIVTQVADINTIVADIATSAQEQAVGLDQINGTITQMDRITQHNAGMVAENTAASHVLMQETEELFTLVKSFKVGGEGATASRPPRPSSAPARPSSSGSVVALHAASRGGSQRKVAQSAGADSWVDF